MPKKIITTLAIIALSSTSMTFAQNGSVQVETTVNANVETGTMPPPKRPGILKEFREERREDFKEMRGELKDIKKDLQAGVQAKREWLKASSTATGTKPTPWKDARQEYKEEKKEFMQDRRDDRKDLREDMKDKMKDMMKPKMASVTLEQKTAIAAKLGITVEALNAQIASGTKLKEIIKDKISPDEMRQILPPRLATMTKVMEERGFINAFRARLFGPKTETIQESTDIYGEVTVTKSVETSGKAKPFWQRFFGN